MIADDKPCSPDELEFEPESHLQPGEAAVSEEVLMEDPPAAAEGLADHDPDHMPDEWDGFRLVRASKSSRPPYSIRHVEIGISQRTCSRC